MPSGMDFLNYETGQLEEYSKTDSWGFIR